MKRRDFFISYTSSDRGWAEWIAWELEAAGFSTLLQHWDFRPGSNFVMEMQRASTVCDRTIAVLTRRYFTSLFTQPEWAAAFVRDPDGSHRTLVPVRVEEFQPEGLFAALIYVDLVGLSSAEAAQTLLMGVGPGRRPSAPPPFPLDAASSRAGVRFPRTLPDVWNVPHRRNLHFTGRDELLANVHGALGGSGAAVVTHAISGLGGVGKTQLAIEYAYRYAADYDVVWWIRSEYAADLEADFAELGTRLRLAPNSSLAIATRNWLEHEHRWLIIFDNALAPESLTHSLPRAGGGHVLITSRNPNWRSLAVPLDVKPFDPPTAIEFLLKRTGEDGVAAAREIAERLGHLPLALEQAAAYVEQSGRDLESYLALLVERSTDVLARPVALVGYEGTVATTWGISIARVRSQSIVAVQLLELCAFLAAEDIPVYLFTTGMSVLPEPLRSAGRNPIALDEALSLLRQHSLIELRDGSVSMHRLVQRVVADALDSQTRTERLAQVVRALAQSHSSIDSKNLVEQARLERHLEAVGQFEDELEEELRSLAITIRALTFINRMCMPHPEDPEGAIHNYEALLRFDELHHASGKEVIDDLESLSSLYQQIGDQGRAIDRAERALAATQNLFGHESEEAARQEARLADVLEDAGQQSGAVEHILHAVAIAELNSAGAMANRESLMDPRYLLWKVRDAARILSRAGDGRARSFAERAVAISTEMKDSDPVEYAYDLELSASMLLDEEDFEGARRNLEMATSIYDQAITDERPQDGKAAADSWALLGVTLLRANDNGSAISALERGRELSRRYGEPRQLAKITALLAVAHGAAGARPEALKLALDAMNAITEALNSDHPEAQSIKDLLTRHRLLDVEQ